MLKEFAQYLQSLKDNKTYEINGQIYSDHDLVRIKPYIPHPSMISVTGLDSICKLVRNEKDKLVNLPLFIRVDGPKKVRVFSTFDHEYDRDALYEATCDVPDFHEGFREYEQAIIELRSKFSPGEGTEYLLDLLSKISKENGVTTKDNGVSQQVEARTGISLKAMVSVKPRVTLRPFRTFLEVEQPESEFILRLDDDGNVGLFEADGGMWKMAAKSSVANYLEQSLSDLVEKGEVVVMY